MAPFTPLFILLKKIFRLALKTLTSVKNKDEKPPIIITEANGDVSVHLEIHTLYQVVADAKPQV